MTADRPRIGISLYDHGPTHILALAEEAERLGFSTIWLGEHLVVPSSPAAEHPYRPTDDPPIVGPTSALVDVWSLIGAIASRTSSIRIATGVYLLPLRSPILTALAVATVQELSGGRLILGVGSGWSPDEYRALGVPFEQRGNLLDEHIDIVRDACAGGHFEHHGHLLELAPMQITRWPVAVPIVIGGISSRALRRAAVRGDGWYNPSRTTLEDCLSIRRRIDDMRTDAGTADRPFTYHVRIAGYPDTRVFARYRDAGFDDLTVSGLELWPRHRTLGIDDKLAELHRVASELIEP